MVEEENSLTASMQLTETVLCVRERGDIRTAQAHIVSSSWACDGACIRGLMGHASEGLWGIHQRADGACIRGPMGHASEGQWGMNQGADETCLIL